MSGRAKLLIKAVVAAASISAVLVGGCDTADDEPPPAGPGNGGSITINRITLTWKPEGENLNVTIRAPTNGWVAVGFDPSIAMMDANIIIGYVKGDQVFIRDDYGSTLTSHKADVDGGGRDNVTNKRGKEEEGATEIGFTIPLDSGDKRDRKLVVGRRYKVLLANGHYGEDNFTSLHKTRTAVDIEI